VRRSEYEQPGVPLTSHAEALARMQDVLPTVIPQLHAITEEAASVPRIQGKWSPKQILGHLIDSASNNHHRFVRAQIEDALEMPGYTQTEWVGAQQYEREAWVVLVALWSSYNLHLMHVMTVVDRNKLTSPCTIAGDVSGTLEFLMIDYVAHMEHHLNQIFATSASA
jgi:DinB superfamily